LSKLFNEAFAKASDNKAIQSHQRYVIWTHKAIPKQSEELGLGAFAKASLDASSQKPMAARRCTRCHGLLKTYGN